MTLTYSLIQKLTLQKRKLHGSIDRYSKTYLKITYILLLTLENKGSVSFHMITQPREYSSTVPVMLTHVAETGFEAFLIYLHLYLAVSPSVSFYGSVTTPGYTG